MKIRVFFLAPRQHCPIRFSFAGFGKKMKTTDACLLPLVTMAMLLLSACTTTQSAEVVALGQGTFMVASQALFTGKNGAAADGLRKAEVYCQQNGRHADVTGYQAMDGIMGVEPAKTAVMFKCVI
jgi:hypothetical protein